MEKDALNIEQLILRQFQLRRNLLFSQHNLNIIQKAICIQLHPNLLGVGEPCNLINEAAMTVLFSSWTKFHEHRKYIHKPLLAQSSRRWLCFVDIQQTFGMPDSIYMSGEIWFNTTPEMLHDLRGVTLLGLAMIMNFVKGTWLWNNRN